MPIPTATLSREWKEKGKERKGGEAEAVLALVVWGAVGDQGSPKGAGHR